MPIPPEHFPPAGDSKSDSKPATAPRLVESRTADLSPCGLYRYSLTRRWSDDPPVGFVMLNPSTADATADDPTIRRCVGFAKSWACGGIVVVNLFAYRATDPRDLVDAEQAGIDIVGPRNDAAILWAKALCPVMVAAWGRRGTLRGRDLAVHDLIPGGLACLHVTKDGHPGHPLYLCSRRLPRSFAGRKAVTP